ncbi:MAG: c-type cytochrome [Alphaproteobacteria bacterium]|nr:c-type cytochrome [Alphaproteobacteria bacterium]
MKPLMSSLVVPVIALALAAQAQADPGAGAALFNDQGCMECHYTEGPSKEKTIDDQLAKTGPELWYAGSKFQMPWLVAWLQDPQPIRPLKYNSINEPNPENHPALGPQEAADIADFLMGLTSDVVETGVIEPKKKDRKARLLFAKDQPCGACHQYPAKRKVKGGLSGPSLVGASARLNPDWIYAYLLRPEVFKPIKMMPVFRNVLSEEQMRQIAAYVAAFK